MVRILPPEILLSTDKTNAWIEDLVAEHGIEVLDRLADHMPRYNIAPTTEIPVVMHSARRSSDVIAAARWGVIPPSVKSIADAPRTTFNARAESAMVSGRTGRASMWRTPLTKGQRCLIPASGYYEWTGPKGDRTPHYIYPETGPLMFTGLFGWRADPGKPDDDETRWQLTATILTMPTVPELAEIHDRNPVALPESMWWDWISPDVAGDQALVDAAVDAAKPVLAELSEHVVRPLKGDFPELIQPA